MSGYGDIVNIKLLQQLLTPPDEQGNSDSEDEHLPSTGIHKFGNKTLETFILDRIISLTRNKFIGPGDIGTSQQQPTLPSATDHPKKSYINVYEKVADPVAASIEEWQERQEREDTNVLDSRKRPHYQIAYKQDVTTQDVFLQVVFNTNECYQLII